MREKGTNCKSYALFKIHKHGDTYKEIYKLSGTKMRGGAAYIAGFFSALNVAITLISCMSL
jgi:hypothetical protein